AVTVGNSHHGFGEICVGVAQAVVHRAVGSALGPFYDIRRATTSCSHGGLRKEHIACVYVKAHQTICVHNSLYPFACHRDSTCHTLRCSSCICLPPSCSSAPCSSRSSCSKACGATCPKKSCAPWKAPSARGRAPSCRGSCWPCLAPASEWHGFIGPRLRHRWP